MPRKKYKTDHENQIAKFIKNTSDLTNISREQKIEIYRNLITDGSRQIKLRIRENEKTKTEQKMLSNEITKLSNDGWNKFRN